MFNFFKRSPRVGSGKDHAMSESSQSPAPPSATPDVSQQLAQLTEAVNKLVAAQQPTAPPAGADVGGDIPEGDALAPGVDYTTLSPVQQIAVGLRDAKPVHPKRSEPSTGAD